LQSIPNPDVRIDLHTALNISVGGLAVDVTDTVHPSFKLLFLDLANRLGLRQNGVDLICQDITKDIKQQKYAIIDWNNGGSPRAHQNPSRGKARNVYRAILGDAFPELQSHPLYHSQGGPAPNVLQ